MIATRVHARSDRMVAASPAAISLAVSLVLLAGSAGATTIHVPGDFPAIQIAINNAAPGDTILVAAGTYTGPTNRNLNFAGKDLVLLSSAGSLDTIIDCEQLGRGIVLTSHETTASRIEGFMIRNALVVSQAGGALVSDSGATFVNCIFDSNHSDAGGGIWCNRSTLVVNLCTFIDNVGEGQSQYSGYGGGIWIDRLSRATITHSAFEGNISKRGAGVWVGGGAVADIVDCTFTDNLSRSWGGGIGASAEGTILRVIRSTFSGNTASSSGGGISLFNVSPEILNCQFIDNTSSSRGGGMFLSNSDPIITGTLFSGNKADEDGGGLAGLGSAPTIRSTTFHGNSGFLGGGIFVGSGDGPSAAVIERSIIAFGTLGEAVFCDAGSSADLSCSDVFGNAGGDWVGCLETQLGQDGNFALDPLFCDAAGGNFRIVMNSPCAPANSPPGCNLIGAFPAGCGGVGIADIGAPAAGFQLRVVPNPLFTDGQIEWQNDSSTPIVLKLYDATGRLVSARDLGSVAAGQHSLGWSGTFGSRNLASGVYFLRFEGRATKVPAVRVVITH
jgi:hypothetical protein